MGVLYIQTENGVEAVGGGGGVNVDEVVNAVLEKITGNILPDTRIAEDSGVGVWGGMELTYAFDLPAPLVEGKTYTVTIDGVAHSVTATKSEGGVYVSDGVVLSLGDIWIYYQNGGTEYNHRYNAICEVSNKYAHYDQPDALEMSLIPFTLRIDGEGRFEVDRVYLTATMADGTTKTLRLFGEVV